MPRKPVELLRVPLNCFVAPSTKTAITGEQNQTRESQGEVVDRAVALLVDGEEVAPRVVGKKISRREREKRKLAESDVSATVAERVDIDYGNEELPTEHITSVILSEGRRQESLADWRTGRKPLLKPKEQK